MNKQKYIKLPKTRIVVEVIDTNQTTYTCQIKEFSVIVFTILLFWLIIPGIIYLLNSDFHWVTMQNYEPVRPLNESSHPLDEFSLYPDDKDAVFNSKEDALRFLESWKSRYINNKQLKSTKEKQKKNSISYIKFS